MGIELSDQDQIDGDSVTITDETSTGVDSHAECESSLTEPPQNAWWSQLAAIGLLTLVPWLVFGQLRGSDFISYDDHKYVGSEPLVTGGLTATGAWLAFTTFRFANWHPVTWLSLMLDYSLHGNSPGWFHLTNVFFHIASGWMLFAWLRMLKLSTLQSLLVAMLFSIHPLHVEPVAWVSSRKDVLSTFFLLCSLVCYVRYAARPSSLRYGLVVALLSLGLMSKAMLITAPMLLLMLDVCLLQRWRPRFAWWPQSDTDSPSMLAASGVLPCPVQPLWFLLIEKVPLLGLSFATSVLNFLAQRGYGTIVDTRDCTVGERLSHIIVSYGFYVRKTFMPLSLTLHYPYDPNYLTLENTFVAAALLVLMTVLMLRPGTTRRVRVFGWSWYLISLLPVCGLLRMGGLAAADRYSYVPLIGLFLALTAGLPLRPDDRKHWKYPVGGFAILMCGALAILSHRQTAYWHSSESVFRHNVQVVTANSRSHLKLGFALDTTGKLGEAVVHFRKAIRLDPSQISARAGLVRSLTGQNDSAGVIAVATEAETKFPADLGRIPSLAAARKKDWGLIYYFWGRALLSRHEYETAITRFEVAKSFGESSALLHSNLGDAYLGIGRISEAIQAYRHSIEQEPRQGRWKQKLARLLATCSDATLRNPDEAVTLAKAACDSTTPARAEFIDTLAIAYAAQGNFDDAVKAIRTVTNTAGLRPQLLKELRVHLALFERREAVVLPDAAVQRTDE